MVNPNLAGETALYLMIAAGKHAHCLYESMMVNRGFEKGLPGVELGSHILGIIGSGPVAISAAKKAGAMGMDILSYGKGAAECCHMESGEAFFRKADFILLCGELPDDVRIGSCELQWMGAESFLIDITGGDCVDEAALKEALRNHLVAGAGLAWNNPDPELLRMHNVVYASLLDNGSGSI